MKILVLADVHGERKALSRVLDSIEEKFDLVVCPGDLTDMFNVPQDFSQTDIVNMVVMQLMSVGAPVLCVPGNHDPYESVTILKNYGIGIHGEAKSVGGTHFAGFGGAATPFNTIIEPTEAEIKAALDHLAPKVSGQFVLVVHGPPKGTKLDLIKGKHVGSQAIRDFVESKKPALVISAHIHENEGQDTIGPSTVFYPGPVYEGKYGIVEIKDGKVTCEMKQVK
jgi:Icc-related predicted phosphoesterase